jgi:hypothetical protein
MTTKDKAKREAKFLIVAGFLGFVVFAFVL